MNIINITIPPFPYFFLAGSALYRPGDTHRKRTAIGVFDIIFVEYGELFITENEKPYNLGAGQMLILTPDGTHYSHQPVNKETLFHWVHFSLYSDFSVDDHITTSKNANKRMGSFYNPLQQTLHLPVHKKFEASEWQEILKLLKNIITVNIDKYQQNTSILKEINTSITYYQEIFCQLLRKLQVNQQEKEPSSLALNIMDYIRENYHKDIGLKQIADYFSFHPAHIIRCVKKEYGLTPIELLNQIRIEQAKLLLTYSNMTNSEIATAVGLNSTSYFCRIFKSQTGTSPKSHVRLSLADNQD